MLCTNSIRANFTKLNPVPVWHSMFVIWAIGQNVCVRFCSISHCYWSWVRAPVLRTAGGKLLISATVNIKIACGCSQKQPFSFKCCGCGFQTKLSMKPCLMLMLRQENDVTTQFHICLWHWLDTPFHWHSRRDERVTQRLIWMPREWKWSWWKSGCPAVQEKTKRLRVDPQRTDLKNWLVTLPQQSLQVWPES